MRVLVLEVVLRLVGTDVVLPGGSVPFAAAPFGDEAAPFGCEDVPLAPDPFAELTGT